ncbi:MAG: GlcNAc-P-P-Und epimerase, partial [Thermodesulfobacteriota bacterium]|nr:GlcNAc-P-P-Und epimerase [Thermodesulfobacteriota bacterium]
MPDSEKIACVTGASGMIGNRIVEQLIQNGYRVRALSRKSNYYLPDVEHYHGGVEDTNVLEKFVLGADAVFHCAAELYDETKMWKVNYEGTKRLVHTVNKSNAEYFCFLSSATVVGKTIERHIDEQTPCNPQTTYEKSKYEAEKYISKYLQCKKILILRPMYVVDDYRPGILDNIIKRSLRGRIMVFVKGGERAHIVHAKDVAKASIYFITKSFVSPSYYIVSCDHDEYNTFGWISKIFAAYKHGSSIEKIRRPSIHMPLFLLNILIRLMNKNNKH